MVEAEEEAFGWMSQYIMARLDNCYLLMTSAKMQESKDRK